MFKPTYLEEKLQSTMFFHWIFQGCKSSLLRTFLLGCVVSQYEQLPGGAVKKMFTCVNQLLLLFLF